MTTTRVHPARIAPEAFLESLLANGGFEVWERGEGPFMAEGTFAADEWQLQGVGLTIGRSTAARSGAYALVVNSDPGGGALRQGIESFRALESRRLTFSCMVKADVPGAVRLGLADYDGVLEESLSGQHSGGGDWERLTVTRRIRPGLVPGGPGPHGFGLWAGVLLEAAVSNVLVDEAVLAVGYHPEGLPRASVAEGEEWVRCRRYFERSELARDTTVGWYVNGGGDRIQEGSVGYQTICFSARKSAAPTVTLSDVTYPDGTPSRGLAIMVGPTEEGFRWYVDDEPEAHRHYCRCTVRFTWEAEVA